MPAYLHIHLRIRNRPATIAGRAEIARRGSLHVCFRNEAGERGGGADREPSMTRRNTVSQFTETDNDGA